jgi:hypothetical protein
MRYGECYSSGTGNVPHKYSRRQPENLGFAGGLSRLGTN